MQSRRRITSLTHLTAAARSAGPGFARLVFHGDWRGGRYVSNLSSLQIVGAIPEPATLLMALVGGLAVLGIARRRRG